MNITIMENLVGTLLLPIVGKKWATSLTLFMIVWFVWFVGPSSSILRAASMGSMSLIAILLGRQYWALCALGITSGVMLIIHGDWVFDVSFELSVLSTLGIILFGGNPTQASSATASVSLSLWKQILRSLWGLCRENIRLTLAAQVFTIPFVMMYFHRLSLIAPITNLAIGWVIAPITAVGWIAVLSGFFVLYVGQVFAWMDWILLDYLIRTIQFFGHIPLASFGW
jgi:competence protein ComEC